MHCFLRVSTSNQKVYLFYRANLQHFLVVLMVRYWSTYNYILKYTTEQKNLDILGRFNIESGKTRFGIQGKLLQKILTIDFISLKIRAPIKKENKKRRTCKYRFIFLFLLSISYAKFYSSRYRIMLF